MLYCIPPQDGDDDDTDEATDKTLTSHPDADTTIIFVTGEGCLGSCVYILKLSEENVLNCFLFYWVT